MARRSDHKREELYELALDAAAEIVERDGHRALTARNVADAIGYSPGTLYNLFENLDDMVVHLNGSTLDHLFDRLNQIALSGYPDTDTQMLLNGYLGFLSDHPGRWQMLFEYNLATEMTLPEWYRGKIDKLLAIVEQALEPLFTDTETDRKKNAARTLWACLHGIRSLGSSGKLMVVTDLSVAEMAGAFIADYVAGLARPGAGKRVS